MVGFSPNHEQNTNLAFADLHQSLAPTSNSSLGQPVLFRLLADVRSAKGNHGRRVLVTDSLSLKNLAVGRATPGK